MSLDPHDSDPREELDPDEPHTPLWLPLVGLGLFLLATTYLLVGGEPPPETADTAAGEASGEPAVEADRPPQ